MLLLCPGTAVLLLRHWDLALVLYQRLMKLGKPQPLPDPEYVTTSLHADIERCSKMKIRPRYYYYANIFLSLSELVD